MLKEKEEVKNTFWDSSALVMGRIILVAISLFSISLTARILGPEGYGKLALFLAAVQLFFTLGIRWMRASAVRYGTEEYAQSKKLNKTFWCRMVFLLPTLILAVITISIFTKSIVSYTKITNLNVFLILLFLASLVLSSEVQSYLRALRRLKLYAIVPSLEKIIIVIGLLLIWYNFIPKKISAIIGVYAIGSLTLSLAIFSFLIIKYIFPICINGSYIKRILFYSFPLIFGLINTYIFNWIDIVIIKKFMPIQNVGIYSLAYNGMSMLQQFPMMATVIMIPLLIAFLTKKRIGLIKRYVTRIIPQALFFWVIFLSLCIMAAGFLIPILGGEDFNGAILPFSGLLIGLVASGLGLLYSPVFHVYEMTKHLTFIALVSTPINILGDFILIPKIGVIGAVIATSLSFFISAILRSIVIHRKMGLKMDFKMFIFLLPAFIVLYCFNIRPSVINFTWGTLVFVVSLLAIALKTNLFSREDIEILQHIDMPVFLKKGIEKFYFAMDTVNFKGL